MTSGKTSYEGGSPGGLPHSAVPADAQGSASGADAADASGLPATAEARKSLLLRLDPEVYKALARWAADDNRSVNAQIEILLREALHKAGRAPKNLRPLRRPGRPPHQ